MKLVAFLISLLFAALGAMGTVSPSRLLSVARLFESPAGLSAATLLRVVMGSSLYLSALASRISSFLRVLGVIIFFSGLVTPFFGLKRFSRVMAWWAAQGPAFTRAWAVFALGLGLLLAWAVAPWAEKELDQAVR